MLKVTRLRRPLEEEIYRPLEKKNSDRKFSRFRRFFSGEYYYCTRGERAFTFETEAIIIGGDEEIINVGERASAVAKWITGPGCAITVTSSARARADTGHRPPTIALKTETVRARISTPRPIQNLIAAPGNENRLLSLAERE